MNLLKSYTRVLISIALLLGLSSQAVNAKVTSAPIVVLESKINLNEAQAPAIANIVPGIGIKRAEAIVAYRKDHGKFVNFNDLAKVKGISERYVTQHIAELRAAFIF
jgi:competence protein ComEA